MKRRYFAVGSAIFGVGCIMPHPPNPQPTPSPTPTPGPSPTPTPPPSGLPKPTLLSVKKVNGQFTNQFINAAGQRVWLLGYGGVCCHVDNKINGWPQISEAYLRELAAHGGNFCHIRPGPYSKALEPRQEYVPYIFGTMDFNEDFFARMNNLLDLAESLGVYVEIALTDPWSFKNPGDNYWGVGVNVMRRAPDMTVKRFINKLVKEVGHHPNILWLSGNESGVPMDTVNGVQVPVVSIEWELGVISAAEVQEITSHLPRHIRSTNAGIPKIDRHGDIDYIETHQTQAPEQPHYTGKPVMVNEANPESFKNFEKQLAIAEANGTYYQCWISDMSEGDRKKSLDLIAEYRKTHPNK